jgi:hypothetical protein
MAAVPGPSARSESPSAMVDTTACPYCGSDYGHGPNDCPLCRSARRKDLVVRCVIGLMFLVPILTLFATILLDNGVGKMLSMD